MNVLMIRPDAVLVEEKEEPIQRMFESLGIKCIKVKSSCGENRVFCMTCYLQWNDTKLGLPLEID